jgi:hypothetical protein
VLRHSGGFRFHDKPISSHRFEEAHRLPESENNQLASLSRACETDEVNLWEIRKRNDARHPPEPDSGESGYLGTEELKVWQQDD